MTTQPSQAETMLGFPADFVWGAATAAYQIEGAAAEDGRGPSIWDTFAHTPGNVLGGDTGDVAVDHYHRFAEDVALMSSLGLTAYRFSISWPRVQPGGSGAANRKGLDFYRRLVDALLEAGIQPWPTLYHWDLPQPLEDAGGWPARETAYRFAEYATLVCDAIGDRVANWTTINEPWCAAFLGYASGDHAPGRHDPEASVRAAHHLLLGHGLAAQALRGDGRRVGAAVNLYAVSPASDAPEDVDAARRIDGLQNRFFLDGLLLGRYPEDVLADVAPYDLGVREGDMAIVGGPIDQLGINYYNRFFVTGREGAAPAITSPFAQASPWPGSEHVGFVQVGRPVTAMGWEIDESGLAEVLTRVGTEYPSVPLYVTENGAAFDDVVSAEGVEDPDRVAYLEAHLRACHSVISAGVPLRGYFAWSLMDNFEWGWGYAKRFGLVYVDFATQARIPKSSARWYASVIERGGIGLSPAE
ncbi:GH1 family beta-glucosidase [Actinoallomurus iriomotensis]|uniref:Beta-glucosidase n=1 Tax=Actinoallomurus iriomotensis TaxID=478107 RepID=A0A9W6SA69_9ACTN|nr:GH1 family beta-glucosidase [Actinoallomurus iriomotensis]GLY90184.1 beta-glucosidase [Actinoallomurus iriomotensis]